MQINVLGSFGAKRISNYFCKPSCARGETGRHAILRGWCSYGRGGSNPLVRTKRPSDTLEGRFFNTETDFETESVEILGGEAQIIVRKSMNEFQSKVADGLRKLREESDFSQKYVAEMLGKNDYTGYQRLENGRTELKFEDEYKLARLYNVPMEYIFNPDLRKDEPSFLAKDSQEYGYPKRNLVQMIVALDGTEDQLRKQFDFLKGVNEVIKGQVF